MSKCDWFNGAAPDWEDTASGSTWLGAAGSDADWFRGKVCPQIAAASEVAGLFFDAPLGSGALLTKMGQASAASLFFDAPLGSGILASVYVLPEFIGATSAAQIPANNTDLIIAVPSGVQDGDQLVVVLTGGTNQTFTTPAGWTIQTTFAQSPTKTVVLKRVASSEPASYNFFLTNFPGAPRTGCMAAVRGTIASYAYQTNTLTTPTRTAGAVSGAMILGIGSDGVHTAVYDWAAASPALLRIQDESLTGFYGINYGDAFATRVLSGSETTSITFTKGGAVGADRFAAAFLFDPVLA